ncbi:hypothetical protein [Pleurocapsa sp. PCC 7319]|uniref:hypothetical protein n=1 Tax=Pleurocapsa sp. PCC 7319 TaxID=118161 RepID=UPI00037F07B2|nr:hypothetical protein [Pleurocapsa sp. PCC 7319]
MNFKNRIFSTFVISVLFCLSTKTTLVKSETNDNLKINQAKLSEVNQNFAFAQAITHRVLGSRIVTQFAPKNSQGENIDLNQLASSLGYDHFNWVSYVEKDPYGITNQAGQQLSTPYNDPPRGGYHYDPADDLPFYWDLVDCDRCKQRHHFQNPNNLGQFELVFVDAPADYRLQPGESIEFITNLVGVKNYDVQQPEATWDVLHTFRWKLTNIRPNHSQVSLISTNVDLTQFSPLLLSTMKDDGALLPSSAQISQF